MVKQDKTKPDKTFYGHSNHIFIEYILMICFTVEKLTWVALNFTIELNPKKFLKVKLICVNSMYHPMFNRK